jgi:hypothetical protein
MAFQGLVALHEAIRTVNGRLPGLIVGVGDAVRKLIVPTFVGGVRFSAQRYAGKSDKSVMLPVPSLVG